MFLPPSIHLPPPPPPPLSLCSSCFLLSVSSLAERCISDVTVSSSNQLRSHLRKITKSGQEILPLPASPAGLNRPNSPTPTDPPPRRPHGARPAHDQVGHPSSISDRGEPPGQEEPAGAVCQLHTHPHLPAAHLHHRPAEQLRAERDTCRAWQSSTAEKKGGFWRNIRFLKKNTSSYLCFSYSVLSSLILFVCMHRIF